MLKKKKEGTEKTKKQTKKNKTNQPERKFSKHFARTQTNKGFTQQKLRKVFDFL